MSQQFWDISHPKPIKIRQNSAPKINNQSSNDLLDSDSDENVGKNATNLRSMSRYSKSAPKLQEIGIKKAVSMKKISFLENNSSVEGEVTTQSLVPALKQRRDSDLKLPRRNSNKPVAFAHVSGKPKKGTVTTLSPMASFRKFRRSSTASIPFSAGSGILKQLTESKVGKSNEVIDSVSIPVVQAKQIAEQSGCSDSGSDDESLDSQASEICNSNEDEGKLENQNGDSGKRTDRKPDSKAAEKNINPMTKMRGSLYTLFSNTTSPFHGPGDGYYRFILGGKPIRGAAKKFEAAKYHEIDRGKLDLFVVGPASSKKSITMRNARVVQRERERQKEAIHNRLSSKIDSLEKNRA